MSHPVANVYRHAEFAPLASDNYKEAYAADNKIDHFNCSTPSHTNLNSAERENLYHLLHKASERTLPQSEIHFRNTSIAACHDLLRVLEWVVYHRFLGVDHFFFWYMPDVVDRCGFKELSELHFVTMLEDTDGEIATVGKEFNSQYKQFVLRKGSKGYKTARKLLKGGDPSVLAQRLTDMVCVSQYAKDYDWAMMADADEFLAFGDNIGLKAFLRQNNQYNYISLSKTIYTTAHAVDISDDGLASNFSIGGFPFSPGEYCPIQRIDRQPRSCKIYPRRVKILVRPSDFKDTDFHVHGIYHYFYGPKSDKAVFPGPEVAHFKDWLPMGYTLNDGKFTARPPVDFVAYSNDEMTLPRFSEGYKTLQGDGEGLPIYFDKSLNEWFSYVASRG